LLSTRICATLDRNCHTANELLVGSK